MVYHARLSEGVRCGDCRHRNPGACSYTLWLIRDSDAERQAISFARRQEFTYVHINTTVVILVLHTCARDMTSKGLKSILLLQSRH